MSLKLPPPRAGFDPSLEAQKTALLERADAENYKSNQDIELRQNRLILRSPNGTRYEVKVDNSGTLSATAI